MSAPHADRDGSECWELEDGDTGEALLPPEPVVVEFVGAERQYVHATGLPEYLERLKADRESLEWQAAYWEWSARFGRRKRIWRSGWDHWALKWFAGGDEYGRHTIVVGPWVIALWSCRCDDCKADEARLLAIVDADIDTDTTPEEES